MQYQAFSALDKYNQPFTVYNDQNYGHRAVLDALTAWCYEDSSPDISGEERSKFVPKHILGYLTYEDVEQSLIRHGFDPGKVRRTTVDRYLGRVAYRFQNFPEITPRVSEDLLVELTHHMLQNLERQSPLFLRFYEAYTRLAPPPPMLAYLHSVALPRGSDLKQLCEGALSYE